MQLIYLVCALFAIQTLNFAWATCYNVYFQQKTVCKFAGILEHIYFIGVLCDKNHTLGFAVNKNRFKILESFYIRSLLFLQGFSRRVKLETRAEKTGSPRRLLHAQTLHFLRQNKQVLVLGQFGPLCGNIDGFIIYYIYSLLAFIEYMKCDQWCLNSPG